MLRECPWGANEASHGCARTIENISRIKMVVARASGPLTESSLTLNKFSTLAFFPRGELALECLATPLVDVGL